MMKLRGAYFAMLLFLTYLLPIIGMDIEKDEKKPPFPMVYGIQKDDDFYGLLCGNAGYVRQLINEDGMRNYNKLRRVENTLRSGLEHSDYAKLCKEYGQEVLSFIRCIAYRTKDCMKWHKHVRWQGDLYKAEKIVARNPYIVNYYFIDPDSSYENRMGTPLHYILDKSCRDADFRKKSCLILNNLLKAGADTNCVDKYGNTPMHKVSLVDHIHLLWEFGARSNQKNNDGITPLMYLYLKANYVLVDYLINIGIDLNNQDQNGNTVLHMAVKSKYAQICERLLKHQASFMIRNDEGKTAACYAHAIPEMKELFEPYMQQFVWENVRNHEFNIVERCIKMFPWMSLNLKDKALLQWLEEVGDPEEIAFFKTCLQR